MAVTIVQKANNTNSTSSGSGVPTSVTLSPTVLLNLLVIGVSYKQDGTGSAPSSTPTFSLSGDAVGFNAALGSTSQAIGSPVFDRIGSAFFYAYATSGGTDVTVTATNLGGWGGSDSGISVTVWEVAGSDLSPTTHTAASGVQVGLSVPASAAVGSLGRLLLGSLAGRDDTPTMAAGTEDYAGNLSGGDVAYSAAQKTATPSANDAIQWDSVMGFLLYSLVEVLVSEPFVPTPSLRPFGSFARIPASSFTR